MAYLRVLCSAWRRAYRTGMAHYRLSTVPYFSIETVTRRPLVRVLRVVHVDRGARLGRCAGGRWPSALTSVPVWAAGGAAAAGPLSAVACGPGDI